MKLWKRASGAIQDQKSLLRASLTLRSSLRNPDIEAAVIKATSHDDSCVNYRNAQRVFAWVGVSDGHLQLVLWALSYRMGRTRSWVVALKGLMLLHGVFCCKVPGIQEIGRLPFDLLSFKDKHTRHGKMYSFNTFIRAYYVYLDQKSSFIFLHSQEQKFTDLIWLQKLQGLLDLLLHIKPRSNQMINVLILEAMDCIVIDIYDIYSRICHGIAGILVRIYSLRKNDAQTVSSILQKAKVQREELLEFFEFCKQIGVMNASECPKPERIREECVRELERIIRGDLIEEQSLIEEEKAIIVVENPKGMKSHDLNGSRGSLKTIITDDWEVFDEEEEKSNRDMDIIDLVSPPCKNDVRISPFEQRNLVELPDMISF